MTTTIDAAGRIVLPKAVRERAQLLPGVPIEVRVVDGRVELEPACAAVTVEKRGGVWVATPGAKAPVLTQDQVTAAIELARVPGMETGSGDD